MSEPVTLVEIDRDVCSLTFGVSPCPATGTKCYNTWATCAARSAFAVTTQTLRFAKPRADLPLSFDAIPSVISTSASPTELNVGDVDASSGPLGKRAQATVTFQDHPTSDIEIDPYVSTRSLNPWTNGTFWTKLNARWPTPKGRRIRILDGYIGAGLNEVVNPTFQRSLNGWNAYIAPGYVGTLTRRFAQNGAPAGYGSGLLSITGPIGTYGSSIHQDNKIKCSPGQRLELQARVQVFRGNARLESLFFDEAGNPLSNPIASGGVTEAFGDTTWSQNIDDFVHLWGFVTVPANASQVYLEVRVSRTSTAFNTDLYLTWAYVAQAQNNQILPTPWTPEAFKTREYLIDSIDGPNSAGVVSIRAVDPLRILDDKTSQAPILSRGELSAAITNSQTTLTVTGAVLADYPATGTLRIKGELMTYTGRTISGGIITFTGITRATDGTTAAAHEIESRVQTCIRYTDVNAWEVAKSIIEVFAPAAYAYIDLAEWEAEADQWLDGFIVSAVISEPTGLNQLLAELCRDAQFFIWWDERQQKILLRAVRPPTETPQIFTEDANILAGSQSLVQKPDERISQIWYYYQPRDLSKSVNDEENYRKVRIRIDADAESPREYGESAVEKIFSRWVRTDAIVVAITTRLLARYSVNPYYLTISVDAKDRGTWTADVVDVSTRLLTNTEGLPFTTRYQIISAQETSPGSVVKYVLQNYNFSARYGFWMASDAPTYAAATDEQKALGGWWADADGKISGDDGYEWQ